MQKCPTPISSGNFSKSRLGCRYHAMNDANQSDEPNFNIRVRDQASINRSNPEYLNYSVPNSKKGLDLSFELPQNTSVFPRNIYKREPFGSSISLLISPRDKEYLYTYSPDPRDRKERSKHTLTASRFGYDRFYNEYGVGSQSRGYIEPNDCLTCSPDTPDNVAPNRFYTAYHLENTPTELRKRLGLQPKVNDFYIL